MSAKEIEVKQRSALPGGAHAPPTVLVVDDTVDNRVLLAGILQRSYRVVEAGDGETALRIAASSPQPDLVLLDIHMPGIDGYEVCRRLTADPRTAWIPVIFLTALTQPADEYRGFGVGAVDYIVKPVSAPIVMARVGTHLQLSLSRRSLERRAMTLENEVALRTMEVSTIQEVTMVAMGSLAETRDNETGNHIRRIQTYVRLLIERLVDEPPLAAQLDPDTRRLIVSSAPLHDIGKVGIPDNILLKPGKLTDDEFAVMKTHTALGRDAVLAAERLLSSDLSFLRFAREITYDHHERWDGGGYPRGLAGEKIPISARLMSLADVYDALISRRVYKEPMPHAEAVDWILRGAGSQFDPAMVEAFRDIADTLQTAAGRFTDPRA
jgi:putative two-component system response regulator